MSEHTVFLNTMRLIMGTSSAITNHKNIVTLNRIKIYILEMEDVLFHLNSAVMMPENPEGKSSNNSSGGSADQETMSGLSALSLVYKQFEFDPNKRMIIAGHTDTSGQPKGNFDLSEERAKNILYLLTCEKDKWAEISANRHKVEDYQQIMKFFAEKNGIDCDPVKIDNTWGTKTEKATKGFLEKTLPVDAESLLKNIKADSKKKWPEEVWKAVYYLYIQHICKILGLKGENELKKKRVTLKFVNDTKPLVSCGESFPIDSKEKKNYRSQENRRVEILFFDKDEIDAEKISCPPSRDTVHKEEECPLWKKIYFLPLYIDPVDLKSVVYHFKFLYWDKIKKRLLPVPKGLGIKVFHGKDTEIPTVTVYKKDTYYIKVQYGDLLTDPNLKKVYFQFETIDYTGMFRQWIYTKDTGATPKIVEKSESDIKALSPDEQKKYYDLPLCWKSLNAHVRYEGNDGGAVTDNDIFNGTDKKKLSKWLFTSHNPSQTPKYKPFSNEITKSDKPLVFCLDDLVLANADATNKITTYSPSINAGDVGAILDDKLKVIQPDSGAPNYKPFYTKDFKKYLVTDGAVYLPFRKYDGKMVGDILFDCRLFDVAPCHISKDDPRAGNRAAVYKHPTKNLVIPKYRQKHYRTTIGNFDAYLIRNHDHQTTPFKETKAFLFCYFRWYFQTASASETGWTPVFKVTPAWVEKYITNVMKEWNNSEKLIELVHSETNNNHRIYVRFHMEALDKINNLRINNGDLHTIINVHSKKIKDGSGTQKDNKSFRSNMGRKEANFKESDNEPTIGSGGKKWFTGAHEFGHATSLEDDYHERWNNCSYGLPGFPDFVPGSPYRFDGTAMMKSNDTVRARYFWHFAAWMYKELDVTKKHPFLVKRDKIDYEIGYNTSNTWSSKTYTADQSLNYVNTPVKAPKYGAKNSVSVAAGASQSGKFDLFLYRLGYDPYSININNHSYLKGKRFTSLLIVKVNMYVEFWNDVEYDEIRKFLKEAYKYIEEHFRKKNGIKIQTPDPYLKDIYIQVQPRFLVKNYVKEYTTKIKNQKIKDNAAAQKFKNEYRAHRDAIKSNIQTKPHFTIKVKDEFFGSDEWDTSSSPSTTLKIRKRNADELWKFFSQMLGLAYGKTLTKHNFSVGTYVPDATVQTA